VAEALQHWIGYIPGFGLVQETNIRTLAQQMNAEQDGMTLTVNEVMVSSDKTTVKYSIEGLPDKLLVYPEVCPDNNNGPAIRLPDGKSLKFQGLMTDRREQTVKFEALYPSIPAGVFDLTFELQCTWQSDSGPVLSHWEIPLKLIMGAKTKITIAPVIEITPSLQTSPHTPSEAQSGSLEIERVIPLENSYIISGTLAIQAPDGLTPDEMDGFLEETTITDAANQQLTFGMAPDEYNPATEAPQNGKINWKLQLFGEKITWPVTLTVNSISAKTAPYTPVDFTVDVGKDPAPDQIWALKKDIPFGATTLHLTHIKRLKMEPGFNGYEFGFIYDPSVSFSLQIEGCVANGGGGGGGGGQGSSNMITVARSCGNNLPDGLLNVTLSGNGVQKIFGPWSANLDKPVLP
ncbi:MAG: hypothetical protein LWX83_15620, partial [Anaerolineae bacterium]|nr:hypothetical protein [Anaerolineae bacterium]